MAQKLFTTGVALTDREKEILEQESRRRGLYSISGTLRQIIHEWADLTGFVLEKEGQGTNHDQE